MFGRTATQCMGHTGVMDRQASSIGVMCEGINGALADYQKIGQLRRPLKGVPRAVRELPRDFIRSNRAKRQTQGNYTLLPQRV